MNTAISLENNHAICYGGRGYAYLRKEDYDRAIADFEMALKLDPANTKAQEWQESLEKLRESAAISRKMVR